ncbi:hypothetical protein [Rhodoferax sp. BLA1]|uniref:hypothetical protein n=1 Tax=Rhodoferax sp. BLA1 TaxID=2576062 RepID=UPI0015D26BD5|nr:hypothetical protein [Rhodoferax sp. BLA1]
MSVVTPSPITPGPVVPSSSDPEATFDQQFEAFLAWQKDHLQPEGNALAEATHANALQAQASAEDAATSATEAGASAASAAASAAIAAVAAGMDPSAEDVIVPVAAGGTGATSAAGARENLNAAERGVNSTITEMTGLTTPLSPEQGGTGTTYGEFDAGTRMPFAMATAPLGWTQDTSDTVDNRMLRVVKTAGGGVGGTHSPILNNVVPAHTHGFSTGNQSADHSHTVYDPGHGHSIPGGYYMGPGTGGGYGAGASSSNVGTSTSGASTGISLSGASANHTHSGSTDGGSSPTNWAPRYLSLIICEKD